MTTDDTREVRGDPETPLDLGRCWIEHSHDGTEGHCVYTVAATREPNYVLRLTGEQIGSIDPQPEGDWFTDWDEYEDFVPRRMLDAERASHAALVAAARDVVDRWSGNCDWVVKETPMDALIAALRAPALPSSDPNLMSR
jgi:hypothetical protein